MAIDFEALKCKGETVIDILDVPSGSSATAYYSSVELGDRQRIIVAIGRSRNSRYYEACVISDAGKVVTANSIHGFVRVEEALLK